MKRTAFVLDVTDEDAIDVWFYVDDGRIRDFSVSYRAHIEGAWRVVIRFDTAHGRLHVHRYDRAGHETRRWLEARRAHDYTKALDRVFDDVAGNWRAYRAGRCP